VEDQATITRKHYSEGKSERILLGALRGRKGAITKADAVTLSGLPVDEADGALRNLLAAYKSHLAVTDAGELIYSFDPAMVRRDAVPLREKLAKVGDALWRAFTLAFKIWIVVTLVVYVVAFVAMLLALVFARTSSDRDDRRRGDGGMGGGFPWILYWMMPDWAPPEYRRRMPRGPQKRFYLSVFDFVFGPRPAAVDPLANEKQILSYLRTVGGRITATDLVALTGWSYTRAEEEATRLLADYDGEPEVTEDGTIVYSFPQIRTTAGSEAPGPWLYTWQEKRVLPSLTGNTSGANTAVVLMNAFNLVAALFVGPAFLFKFGIASSWADLAVTWFPLAFSAIFFAIPGVRWLRQGRRAKRIARASARAALIGELISKRGAAAFPDDLVERAASRTGIEPIPTRVALEELLRDLDGDVTTDGDGRMLYGFPRIDEELSAGARARLLASTAEQAPGTVIFSSDDQPPPPRSHLN
jgi:hypothetical protein